MTVVTFLSFLLYPDQILPLPSLWSSWIALFDVYLDWFGLIRELRLPPL